MLPVTPGKCTDPIDPRRSTLLDDRRHVAGKADVDVALDWFAGRIHIDSVNIGSVGILAKRLHLCEGQSTKYRKPRFVAEHEIENECHFASAFTNNLL